MIHEVQFEIDTTRLSGYTDEYVATLWHIAQANPAPVGDLHAGVLAEAIGREIIVRFLRNERPALYNHQGADHYITAAYKEKAPDTSVTSTMVLVPGRTLPNGLEVPTFLYAKYPCSKSANGTAILDETEKPWVSINYADAVAACVAAGGHLSRESQELAIRLDVCEQDINWTGGKVGAGRVFQGVHRGVVSSGQAANHVESHPDERTWHQLSNGERVYGLAGNVFNWVFDDIQGDEQGLVKSMVGADSPSLAAAPFPPNTSGMGYRPDGERNWSGYALIRGGCWCSEDGAGVFHLDRGSPVFASGYVGFRYTKPGP